MDALVPRMFTVYKRDFNGNVVFTYPAQVIERGQNFVCIEATFTARDKVEIAGLLTLLKGDRMVEWFYSDRWYNIFQVHSGESDEIKGWYCNITRPAQITADSVASDDLALDMVISISGQMALLDENEFHALDLPPAEHASASAAVHQLHQLVTARQGPFVCIDA